MFLLSGTFFPLSVIPNGFALQVVALGVFPLTHIVNMSRGLMSGSIGSLAGLGSTAMWAFAVVWVALVTVMFFLLAIYLMKKKLIK